MFSDLFWSFGLVSKVLILYWGIIFENEFIGKFNIDSFKNNIILNKCNSLDEIFEIFNDIISSNKDNQKLSNIIEETNQLLLIIPFWEKKLY